MRLVWPRKEKAAGAPVLQAIPRAANVHVELRLDCARESRDAKLVEVVAAPWGAICQLRDARPHHLRVHAAHLGVLRNGPAGMLPTEGAQVLLDHAGS